MKKVLPKLFQFALVATYRLFITIVLGLLPLALVGNRLIPSVRAAGTIQVDLTTSFDVDGISFDANPGDGDFDFSGNTFSADTFPATITVGGIDFITGPTTDGSFNAVGTNGQNISLPASQAMSLQFLAAEGWEDAAIVPFTVNYTDATSTNVDLGISFWIDAAPAFGETVAYTQDHINTPTTQDFGTVPNIYLYTIPLDSAKIVESIDLPVISGDVRIFAMSLTDATAITYSIPTVTTNPATNIGTNSVRLNGNVDSDGNDPIFERGFVYSTVNAIPEVGIDSTDVLEGTTGSLTSDWADLLTPAATTVYVRAYATNNQGTGYGAVQTFNLLEKISYVSIYNIPNNYTSLGIPMGITVLDNGNIWYVDQQNNRVVQVNQAGQILRTLGRQGTADGEFSEVLQAITQDDKGNLYVLDSCYVYKLDSNGGFIRKWGECYEATETSMREARGIAFDNFSDTILVTDTEHHRVIRFSLSGEYLSMFGTYGTGTDQLYRPQGLDVDATGRIFVVDGENHRVQVFDNGGSYLMSIGSIGVGDAQFTFPKDVVVLSDGKIAVTSQNSQRIQVFNADGSFSHAWGENGTAQHQFVAPASIARDPTDNLFVTDWMAKSIQKFSSIGTYSLAIRNSGKTDGKFSNPTFVDYDAAGNMYVLDDGFFDGQGRVQKFTNSGTYISTIIQPGVLGVACYHFTIDDVTGHLLVTCLGGVRVFDLNGVFQFEFGIGGTGNGEFGDARGIGVNSLGDIFVVDASNSRVQKFDSAGNYLAQWGTAGMGNGEFNWPESLYIDSNDEVYVAENQMGDRGIGLTPNTRIQVFNSSGVYLRTIGTFGGNPDQLWIAGGILVDNTTNRLYVVNQNTQDIKVFTASEGVFLHTIGSYGSDMVEFNTPTSLAMNPITQTITIADTENHRVQAFATGTRIVNLIPSDEVVRQVDSYSLSNNYLNPGDPGVNSIESHLYFGDYVVSDFLVDLSSERDWSQVSAITMADTSKSLITNLTPGTAPGVSATHAIYVIKQPGQVGVRVCPDAASLTEVTMSCGNGYFLLEGEPTLTTVTVAGVDYWRVAGLTGTGAMSVTTQSLTIEPETFSVNVGESFGFTVNALNVGSTVDTTYRETVVFTSTSGSVTLPATYAYTDVDSGTHRFTAIFSEPGDYTITVTDSITSALTATSSSIHVSAIAPTVTTGGVSAVTVTEATVNGTVSFDGGSAITQRGFVYSPDNTTPTILDSTFAVIGTTGAFTGNLTSLLPNTLYYVRAFATNGVNTSYGAVVSFTTDVLITAPVVVSDSVTGVTISAATVNGTVNSDGGTAITERGFVYSASNGSPTVADQKVAIAGTTGAMQYALINLSSDTVYFIRAFATNNQGTTYGTVLTFRTVKEATIIRNLGTTPVDTGAVTEEPTVGETIVTSPLEGNNITDDMTPTTSPTETPIPTKSEESKSENLVTTTITLFGSAIFILLGVLFFRSKKKNTEGIGQ